MTYKNNTGEGPPTRTQRGRRSPQQKIQEKALLLELKEEEDRLKAEEARVHNATAVNNKAIQDLEAEDAKLREDKAA
jgi:hypothetical protein